MAHGHLDNVKGHSAVYKISAVSTATFTQIEFYPQIIGNPGLEFIEGIVGQRVIGLNGGNQTIPMNPDFLEICLTGIHEFSD